MLKPESVGASGVTPKWNFYKYLINHHGDIVQVRKPVRYIFARFGFNPFQGVGSRHLSSRYLWCCGGDHTWCWPGASGVDANATLYDADADTTLYYADADATRHDADSVLQHCYLGLIVILTFQHRSDLFSFRQVESPLTHMELWLWALEAQPPTRDLLSRLWDHAVSVIEIYQNHCIFELF